MWSLGPVWSCLQRWHFLLSSWKRAPPVHMHAERVPRASKVPKVHSTLYQMQAHAGHRTPAHQTGVRLEGIMPVLQIQCFPTLPLYPVPTFSNSHYLYPGVLGKVGSLRTTEESFQSPVPIRDSHIPIPFPRDPNGQSQSQLLKLGALT